MRRTKLQAVLVAAAAAVSLASCSGDSSTQTTGPTPHTVALANGVVTVAAGTWATTQVNVTSDMLTPSVTGTFTAAGGSGNDIKVYVMSATDYTNWSNGHSASAVYSSGQVTTGSYNVLLVTGTYYVVYDNSFSVVSAKNVSTLVDLNYEQ